MTISNKKIKYIKNTIGQKTIKELSVELNVSEQEIEDVLKSLLPSDQKVSVHDLTSRTNSTENLFSGHSILIYIQAVLIFLAPLICMSSSWHNFANLAQGIYIQSISGFMVFIWLLDCYSSKKFEIKKSQLYLPIACVLIWSALSFFWATNISESLEIMSLWTACAVIYFVLYNMIKSPFDSTIFFIAIISSMCYLIFIGLLQFFDPSFNLYNQVFPPSATFGNKNMLSDYLIIVLPLSFYFYMSGSDRTKLPLRIISGCTYVAGILLIIFSFTRAGMLAFPIVLTLFFIFLVILKRNNSSFKTIFSKQKIILGISFLCIFIVILSTFVLNAEKGFQANDFGKRIKSIFVMPDKDKEALAKNIKDEKLNPVSESTTIRLITWRNTIEMIKAKPLHGYGLYNWQIHYGEYRNAHYNDPTYSYEMMLAQLHNDYLQILADLGIIGFLLFAWLIFCIFVMFKRIFFSPNADLDYRLKALSLILGIIGFGISSIFSFLIVKSIPTLLLFTFIALLGNLYYYIKPVNGSKPELISFHSKTAGLLLIPILIISIVVTTLELRRGIVDQLYKTALDNHKHQNHQVVIENVEKILQLNPLHYKSHLLVASSYSAIDNFEESSFHIERGLKYYPNDLLSLYKAGTIYVMQLKKILLSTNPAISEIKNLEEKSIFWYMKALEIRTDYGKIWNNLGFIYEKQSQRFTNENNLKESSIALQKAEESYNKAIALEPDNYSALLNKANIHEKTGRSSEIIPIALKVLKSSFEKFKNKNGTLQELIDAGIEKNAQEYKNALVEKNFASQVYMSTALKAIFMLKDEYKKAKNYQAIPEVFEFEKQYLDQELELKKLFYQTALEELELVKRDSRYLRKGVTQEQLEINLASKKLEFEKGEKEFNLKSSQLQKEISENSKLIENNK